MFESRLPGRQQDDSSGSQRPSPARRPGFAPAPRPMNARPSTGGRPLLSTPPRVDGVQTYVRPGGTPHHDRPMRGGRSPMRRPGSHGAIPRTGAPTQGGRPMRRAHSSTGPTRGGTSTRRASTLSTSSRHFTETKERAEESGEIRAHIEAKKVNIPPLTTGDVRVVILGGVEEIGRNMAAFEFGNDIIIVDCGFMFKDEDTPGIDYILPNTQYLEERKDRIRAVVITHGHLDHTGGLPYILNRIGNPPVYARNLTALFIQKRHEEFPSLPPLDMRIVETDDRVAFGDLAIRFFKVTHTIPDAMGIIIETPYGVIVHTGDLKLDHVEGVPTDFEEKQYAKFKDENVLLLLADSTNCQRPGYSIPEPVVHKNLEEIIRDAKGRMIIATFSSLLERIIKIIEVCERLGKKVVVDGRSMKTNIELAQKAKLFTYKKGTIIAIEEMEDYPPDRIVMLVTGAQGDAFAVLMRAAMKKHKNLKIREGDTVLFSSSVVPGNERAVQKLKDLLSRQGGRIVHYESSDVHSSGHGSKEEMRWIINKIHPKFFIPLHGYHYMLRSHAELSVSAGVAPGNALIPDDGIIIEFQDKGEKMVRLEQNAPKEMVAVDGFSIGNLQEVVMRDRQMLAEDGIVVLVATVDMHTGKLMKSPDIIARGFVYVRESQELLNQTRLIVKKAVEDACGKNMKSVNFEYVKEDVRDRVGKFLFQETSKQPMVIPVLLGI